MESFLRELPMLLFNLIIFFSMFLIKSTIILSLSIRVTEKLKQCPNCNRSWTSMDICVLLCVLLKLTNHSLLIVPKMGLQSGLLSETVTSSGGVKLWTVEVIFLLGLTREESANDFKVLVIFRKEYQNYKSRIQISLFQKDLSLLHKHYMFCTNLLHPVYMSPNRNIFEFYSGFY